MKQIWKYLKSGNGEVLGFMYITPILLILTVTLISVYQAALMKQKLSYTAYAVCRAAVVREDYKTALECARDVLKADLNIVPAEYEKDSVKVELRIIGPSAAKNAGKKDLSKLGSRPSKSNWKKGNYLICTVSADIKTYSGFISGTKKASVVMLLERPDIK